MTRYQVLRHMKCEWLSAASVAFFNWLLKAPANEIRFMTVVIEFDPDEPAP